MSIKGTWINNNNHEIEGKYIENNLIFIIHKNNNCKLYY